jgi:L-lactate dehydrogenase
MPRLHTPAAEALAAGILEAHGTPADIAADVAAHLTLADRAGHASHGLSILPAYLAAAERQLLNPTARPTVHRDAAPFLSFDGHRGFGQHVGKVAVLAAIAQAREQGCCLLTIRDSYHLGRAGHYGEMAARAGLVYLSFLNVVGLTPMVAPFGGREARLNTNPLCFASPVAPGHPLFLLDYATSGVAANKVRLMAAAGVPVPPDMLIDSEGRPTRDASALMADPPGALLPFGAHKGYALGFFAEMLAGVMSGGGTIAPRNPRDGGMRNNLLAIVFDPTRFGEAAWQAQEAGAFADYVTGCPPAVAGQEVMVPGEPEAAGEGASEAFFDMSDAAWELFAGAARKAGLDTGSCLE